MKYYIYYQIKLVELMINGRIKTNDQMVILLKTFTKTLHFLGPCEIQFNIW